MALRMTQLPKYFGMPPDTLVSENVKFNSMPVLEIVPHLPKFQRGLSLFKLDKAWDGNNGYKALLETYGYQLESTPIRLAFLADNFPTDSFSNEYSDSFLNRVTDVASSAAAELAQITGSRSAGEGADKIIAALKEAGGMAGALGSGVSAGKAGVENVGNALANSIPSLKGGGAVLSSIMAGARVDFPQIWKNSGFQPSYSITCRLYNPAPGNAEATEKYIIGPIAAILCLNLPQTKDGHTYSWPFLHKIKCRGLFDLRAAFISNITIIKGGDQQQIAWNQRLGIVDIRIDFGGLYSSMLAGADDGNPDKSTLEAYLDILRDEDTARDMYTDPKNGEHHGPGKYVAGIKSQAALAANERNLNLKQNVAGQTSGYKIEGPGYKETVTSATSAGQVVPPQKQFSHTMGGAENVTDTENFQTEAGDRVSAEDKATSDYLDSLMPQIG